MLPIKEEKSGKIEVDRGMGKDEIYEKALKGKRVPVLTLDNKWHRLFSMMEPDKILKETENELNTLLKRQGKLNTENLGKNSEFAVPLRCMDAVGEADFACAIKILVLGNKDELSKIARKFNEDDTLTIVSSGVGLIDIMAKGATKGGAVCALAERLGIAMEHVAVFGDSPNDISMFEVGGVRVAVENAVDEVKRLATFITKDNNQSGVAHALSRLFGSI